MKNEIFAIKKYVKNSGFFIDKCYCSYINLLSVFVALFTNIAQNESPYGPQ